MPMSFITFWTTFFSTAQLFTVIACQGLDGACDDVPHMVTVCVGDSFQLCAEVVGDAAYCSHRQTGVVIKVDVLDKEIMENVGHQLL